MENLTGTARTGSIGEQYMRLICSSAGYSSDKQGQDVNAIDINVEYPFAQQRVQVKCTTVPQWISNGNFLSYPIENQWKIKWKENEYPPIFVVVVIPDEDDLFDITDEGSLLRKTQGYWLRLDLENIPDTVHIPKTNRLNEDAVRSWETYLIQSKYPNTISEANQRR
ncbi:DUF4365 domain-containing protein [Bifidobacterium sp. ESL0769]|uniref:DUF4365 domain-containing protein n=1 Tax=Bifidobacterium sp. ESL0769 TaxID=2983229 RepID=UPI0023FA2283|nr:DUF4365 domain-containing protein [Bifidobacterium sp. ESL0769]WEV66909.1 DUF4365 domain-containing protein [Bifidobacterium sp. ESL0769]